jgi:hypothetical protein
MAKKPEKIKASQRMLLHRADRRDTMLGTSSNFEHQFGTDAEVDWGIKKRLVKKIGGRIITTIKGKEALKTGVVS